MLSRRTLAAMLTATFLLTLLATPASAAKPTKPPTGGERPLTTQEAAAAQRKVAGAEAYEASIKAAGTDLVSLSCLTPESQTESVTTLACAPPQGFLGMEARDQVFGHYCGPAVGQVIANYSWAMAAGRNVFSQQQLAGWMQRSSQKTAVLPNIACAEIVSFAHALGADVTLVTLPFQ